MNRFRKLGFIDYDGRITVHKSLLNVILHDQLPGQNAQRSEVTTEHPPRNSIVSKKRLT
jgi:hypothetical protein